MSRTPVAPENCPDPSLHDTFRYCPLCTWIEEPEVTQPKTIELTPDIVIEQLISVFEDSLVILFHHLAKRDEATITNSEVQEAADGFKSLVGDLNDLHDLQLKRYNIWKLKSDAEARRVAKEKMEKFRKARTTRPAAPSV